MKNTPLVKLILSEIQFIQISNLARVLGIKAGITYNGVELRTRIADETNPDGLDLTNVYQNSGYMFSTINPVEVSAEGNVIDLEIRISEGKPAYFNNVTYFRKRCNQ